MERRLKISPVILAAGKGVRMGSPVPKVMHILSGRPLVGHVVESALSLRSEVPIVVTGFKAREVERALDGTGVRFARQSPQLGTGHALMCVRRRWGRFRRPVLVLLGDVPLVRPETMRRLVDAHLREAPALTVLTAVLDDPGEYGRIVRDAFGRVRAIVEAHEADARQREIREINTGLFVFDPGFLEAHLFRLQRQNRKGEFYLTDLVAVAFEEGRPMGAMPVPDAREVQGINHPLDLQRAHEILRQFTVERLGDSGVLVRDPRSAYVEAGVRVGAGTVLDPNVHLQGRTAVGSRCRVGTGAVIRDSVIADGAEILPYCVIEESRVGAGARVGPFARMRPGSVLEAEVRVGNFVELKKSRLGRGTKAQHLSYLGDATIGPGVNVGAGTITCNYDGHEKHPTVLGADVFVGSDTQFVAPVRVGRGAYIGAGSTITRNVPPGALALSRARQVNVKGWVERKNRAARGRRRKR